jgi:hypothetical protein
MQMYIGNKLIVEFFLIDIFCFAWIGNTLSIITA